MILVGAALLGWVIGVATAFVVAGVHYRRQRREMLGVCERIANAARASGKETDPFGFNP